MKRKVQTSTELGRNLSWKMGGHCSELFVTKGITQLVSALGVAWEFPQGENYWAVERMLLEESSEDVVVESSANHKEELLGGFWSFTAIKL